MQMAIIAAARDALSSPNHCYDQPASHSTAEHAQQQGSQRQHAKKEMRPIGKLQAEEQCRVQHRQALVAHASRAGRCMKLTCWSRVSLS